jgi:hypothetical protein
MGELKCYLLERGPSLRNIPIYFGYIMVPPIYLLATFLSYLDNDIGLNEVCLHLAIIFILEWIVRTLLVKQRPGFVCIDGNQLTLWYLAGMVRIEYSYNRYQVLPINEGELLRIIINKRILPLSIKTKNYLLINEKPRTFDFVKIKRYL